MKKKIFAFFDNCSLFNHLDLNDILSKFDDSPYISNTVFDKSKLTPYFNIDIPIIYNEFSISRKKDKKKINDFFNDNIIKEYNCKFCYLSEKDSLLWNIDSENNNKLKPNYTEIIPKNVNENYCENLIHFTINEIYPEKYYNHLTITTKSHINTNSFYTKKELFNSVFSLLNKSNDINIYHNELYENDHFHIYVSKNDNYIVNNYKSNLFIDYPYIKDVKIAKIREPVQKGIILMANNPDNLFECVNRLYTKLITEKNINDKYYLSETIFHRDNLYFIGLFLFDRIGPKNLIPNEGVLLINHIDDNKDTLIYSKYYYEWKENMLDISNIDTFENTFNYYLTNPEYFFESPMPLDPNIIYSKQYIEKFNEIYTLDNIYNHFIIPVIVNILNTNFIGRNGYNNYIKYKILLTMIFRNSDNRNNIIGNIYKIEIQYISKLLNINTNLSFLKGDSLIKLIKFSMENDYFFEMVDIEKRIGDPSAYGVVYKTVVSGLGDLGVKFTINNDQAELEFLINKDVNRLRKILVHFYVCIRYN